MPAGQGYIFVLLLALTVGTVALVLMQVLFGLLEVKKRKLQERLGGAPEAQFDHQPAYGPITMTDTRAIRPKGADRVWGIETVFVGTTLIVTAAFWLWFIFLAGSPLPTQ